MPLRLPTVLELTQIVRRAEQLPFTGTGLFPSLQEPITASDVLDLPEHPTDESILKVLHLGMQRIAKKWGIPIAYVEDFASEDRPKMA